MIRKKIEGLDSAYRAALGKSGENMIISANLVKELIENYSELQNAVIDLKASLRTCQNTSNAIMEQYKDL